VDRLRLAGVLWVVASLLSIATTVIFRVDQVQVVLTSAAGLIALALGAWMLLRPTTATIRSSSLVGAVWVILYVALALIQADEIAAWTTDMFVGLVGLAAAFLAFRASGDLRSTMEPR
jgi:uncharacterized membrane protein HdeD (DUF308 family)